MILAAAAAYDVTEDAGYRRAAEAAYGWFLGDNDLGLAVADVVTGGCHDGLSEDHVNLNQGAESTLMWLTAVEAMRRFRSRSSAVRAHRTLAGAPVLRGDQVVTHAGWDIFTRHPDNPIITADQLPYRANSVFNPGAGRVEGETLLLIRVEDLRGISHLLAARSSDGATGWQFDAAPLIAPEPDRHPEEIWGCEDPRLTWLAGARPMGDRLHRLQPARPARLAGHESGLHGGPPTGPGHATGGQGRRTLPAPDRRSLGDDPPPLAPAWVRPHLDLVFAGPASLGRPRAAARGARRRLVGCREDRPGPPPLETPDGWLICYHGVHGTASGPIYRVGLALLDLEEPRKVLRRTDEWVLAPTAPYERSGDVNKVVFPTGWVLDETTQQLSIYYGAGDSVIALVTANLQDVLAMMRTMPAS